MNGKLAFRTLLGGMARYRELADAVSCKLSLISYNSCVSNAHHHHHSN